MGFHGFEFAGMNEIFEEHCRITEGTKIDISKLDYNLLKEKRSIQWPYVNAAEATGEKRLFTDKQFYTPSQKAIIHSFDDVNQSEPLTPDRPLVLTTGRIRDQWHTMTKTGKVNKLKQHIPNTFLEITPADAAERS